MTLAGAADPAPMSGRAPPAPGAPDPASDTLVNAPQPSGDPRFDAWRADYMLRAITNGVPADVLAREFTGLTPDPTILALQSRQPEFSKPVGDYVRNLVSDARVAEGEAKLAALTGLPAIADRFGVPAEILIAVWAVESNFGTHQGDFDILRSLATLASAGVRQDWAESQITAVIQIIATGQATRAQLRGSWTGAMGQTQFEPSQYLSTAVDGDGDGVRDIWNSIPDALASAANLLAKAGWVRGERWQREMIIPPGFDYGLCEGPTQVLSAWTGLGLRTADGLPWGELDAAAPAMLLLPSGAQGPAYLALPNHFVLRQYNNSLAYALAVGLLADRIAGRAGQVTPWPAEIPLSIADRTAAQTALIKLGFDPGGADGLVGAKTRQALRLWQKQRGLIADGYLSPDMVRLLLDQAGLPPPALPPPTTTATPPAGPGPVAAP